MQRRSIGLWSPARVASLHSHAGRAEEAILAALVLVWARILAADGGCSRCRRESGVLRAEISTDALVIVSWMAPRADEPYSMHKPCAVHAAIWVHLVGLG